MNDMHNFDTLKQNAINQLFELNKKSTKNNCEQGNIKPKINYSCATISRPFLSDDEFLIVGLLLVLSKDCQDMWLFLALIYILL